MLLFVAFVAASTFDVVPFTALTNVPLIVAPLSASNACATTEAAFAGARKKQNNVNVAIATRVTLVYRIVVFFTVPVLRRSISVPDTYEYSRKH
jgi:hypothetical protein